MSKVLDKTLLEKLDIKVLQHMLSMVLSNINSNSSNQQKKAFIKQYGKSDNYTTWSKQKIIRYLTQFTPTVKSNSKKNSVILYPIFIYI